MRMSVIWRAVLFVPLLVVLYGPASALEPTFSADGAAIRGYDPVAYFTRGEPTAGDSSIAHNYQGATWLFANTEHRDLFAADPAKYAPAVWRLLLMGGEPQLCCVDRPGSVGDRR